MLSQDLACSSLEKRAVNVFKHPFEDLMKTWCHMGSCVNPCCLELLCGEFKSILDDLINGTSRIGMLSQERLQLLNSKYLKEGEYRSLSVEEWALSDQERNQIRGYIDKFKALFCIADYHAHLCYNNDCVVPYCYILKEEQINLGLQTDGFISIPINNNNASNARPFDRYYKTLIYFWIEDRINNYSDLKVDLVEADMWYKL